MIVTCPECATRYDVADKAFSSGGRAVRCNHCGCEWYQIGPSGARGGEYAASPAEFGEQAEDVRDPYARSSGRGRFDMREEERRLPLERDDRLQGEWSSGIYPGEEASQRRSLPAPDARPPAPAMRSQEVSRRARGGRRDVDASAGRRPRGRQAQRRSMANSMLFPLSGVALAGLIAGAIFYGPSFQDQLSAGKPPLTPVEGIETATSAAVSSPAARRSVENGLVFVEHKYDLVERAEGPALEAWGRVANNSQEETLSPTIEIISKDKDGKALERWLAQPDVESIGPGESARFRSRLMYPKGPVHKVEFFIAAR